MKLTEFFAFSPYCKICQIAHPEGEHWWDNVSAFFLGYRKCMYCKKYCNRSEFPEHKADYRWWSCHQCGVTYSYHDQTNKLNMHRFVRQIHGKEFLLYLDDEGGTRLFAETPEQASGTSPELILHLNHKLDICPENALDKMKTLLMFS